MKLPLLQIAASGKNFLGRTPRSSIQGTGRCCFPPLASFFIEFHENIKNVIQNAPKYPCGDPAPSLEKT